MEHGIDKPSGVLYPHALRRLSFTRLPPAPALAHWIERYWIVRWSLPAREQHAQETLPHPCINLVYTAARADVIGVMRRRAREVLDGEGWVFGVKLKPGALHAWWPHPADALTDAVRPIAALLGPELAGFDAAAGPGEDDAAVIARFEAPLLARPPAADPRFDRLGVIIDAIVGDAAITRVEHLAERYATTPRALQRLFRHYVGVGPKWVIRRYRLQAAVDTLAAGAPVDWAGLALGLGYFDQSHFIRDFTALVGVPPAAYARAAGG